MNYRWMLFRNDGPWHFALDLRELDPEIRKHVQGTKKKTYRCRCGIEFQPDPLKVTDNRPEGDPDHGICPRCAKCLHWDEVRKQRQSKTEEFRRVESTLPTISQELID